MATYQNPSHNWWIKLLIAAVIGLLFGLINGKTTFAQSIVRIEPINSTEHVSATVPQEDAVIASKANIAGGEEVSQAEFDSNNTLGSGVGLFTRFTNHVVSVTIFCSGWRPLDKNGNLANGIFAAYHCVDDPYGSPALEQELEAAGIDGPLAVDKMCAVSDQRVIYTDDMDDDSKCRPVGAIHKAPRADQVFIEVDSTNLHAAYGIKVCPSRPAIGTPVQIAGWGDGWLFPQPTMRWMPIDSGHQEVVDTAGCLNEYTDEICTNDLSDSMIHWRTRSGDSGAALVVDYGGTMCAVGTLYAGNTSPYSLFMPFSRNYEWLVGLGIVEAQTEFVYLPLVAAAVSAVR